MDFLANGMTLLIPLVLSLTVHEWAHAYSARLLGDDTALLQGRLTLNPLPHIDPIGTLLLPLLGIPFGWAKPVPVNPARFKRNISMGTGMAITAAAGPVSNIILAVACTVTLGLFYRFSPELALNPGVSRLLIAGIQLNVALALFNLLPIPPLDGSRILQRFIPRQYEEAYANFARFAPLLLIAVIVSGGFFLDGPRRFAGQLLNSLLIFVAG